MALLLCLLFLSSCNRDASSTTGEHAYVVAPQVALRDRVAAVYNKVGFVNNGDRVEVLDHSSNKRFVKVRSEDGKEGWIEQRFLASQAIYDGFQRLAQQNTAAPAQAQAITRRVVNMHIEPARDSDRLFQLKEGDKLELLKRASTPRGGMKTMAAQNAAQASEDIREREEERKAEFDDNAKDPEAAKSAKEAREEAKATAKADARAKAMAKATAKPSVASPGAQSAADPNATLEDWWLVRDARKRVGWVLGRMMDVDVPLEIAQYAEGQRIIASFILSEVTDPADGKRIPQYAVLMTPNKDGLPFDFDQMRIFTWNMRRSRYETAYHERFQGMLPFTIVKESDKREGTVPLMTARAIAKDGTITERKYRMFGVMVRKVK